MGLLSSIGNVLKSVAGPLVGGALGLIGGSKDRESAENQAALNTATQKEFAQHGIQWKVEDAKKAGVHPLYALGAQTHSFAPNPIFTNQGETLSRMGQDLSRAFQASQTKDNNDLIELQKQLLIAQINRTNAEAENLVNNVRSSHVVSLPLMGSYQGQPIVTRELPEGQVPARPSPGKQQGAFVYEPDKVVSRRAAEPHVTAGTDDPLFKTFRMSGKREVLLPKTFTEDAEIPLMLWPSIIQANVQKYGLLHTIRAFGGGESKTDDPISQAIIRILSDFNSPRSGRFPTLRNK